ncbi:MAG: Major facilitator superfamily protein [Candidatus Tokpelaia sp. JSC188]|nr:MAG: Major facilitator superfamily protein [Candidatus Tokpelaia sp. JSC188]
MMNNSTKTSGSSKINIEDTLVAVILATSFSHLLNDVMQSILPAVYPLLRFNYNLSLFQVGIITTTYQSAGSLLQPLIGIYTDKKPLPYSLPFASTFMMGGLLLFANARSYSMLLVGAVFVGLGSSIFHPEASRVVRIASGGKYGFAQSVFQLGGNIGTALGPLLAALFISQQQHITWCSLVAFISMIILFCVSHWYANNLKKRVRSNVATTYTNLSRLQMRNTLFVLVMLMLAKYIYLSCIGNFYTFFAMEKFGIDIYQAQYLLFLYFGGIAIGTIFGGPISDRIGAGSVIWVSILGVLPFTLLLPHVSLIVMAALSVIIGMILASAFPAIIVFAQELMPDKVGTIAGLFFGLAFGIGAISTAALGALGDMVGNQNLFTICSFLPLLGIIAVFLPKLKNRCTYDI